MERAGIFEQYLPVIARKAAHLAGEKVPEVSSLIEKVAGVKIGGKE